MKRKKEIIIIACIVIISIILIFLPIIINNSNNNKEEAITEIKTEEENNITITVYGEITYQPINSINDDDITNELSFEAKSGITYGEIINVINNFLTKYSIVDNNLTKRYYKTTRINIKSSNDTIEEEEINDNKINLNCQN